MATLFVKSAGGNFSAAGTWSNVNASGVDNSGPPVAGDNCIAELLSGNLTIDANSAARSFDTTSGAGSWGGTLTHNAFTWSIGDGTAGAGNVALKFNSGMTYTLSSPGTTSFVSTQGTQQTIDYAGKTAAGLNFNGANGNWAVTTALNLTGSLILTSGTAHLDGAADTSALTHNFTTAATSINFGNVQTTRVINLGAATYNLGGNLTAQDLRGLTLTSGTSVINLTGATSQLNIGGTNGGSGGKAFYTMNMTGSGGASFINNSSIGGGLSFTNFTRTGTAVKTDTFTSGGSFTVTGNLRLDGNSVTNRLLVKAVTLGTAITITITGATFTNTANVDFRDITFTTGTTDLSAITGGAGDCGGNSGITFTTAVDQYWYQNAGNWSDVSLWFLATGGTGGAGRVPLPQDNAIFDASSLSATNTVTLDMPRSGKTIDTTAETNALNFSKSISITQYGSLLMRSNHTFTTSASWTFEGRGSFVLQPAGTFGGSGSGSLIVNMIGGTLTLGAALAINSSLDRVFDVSAGTFDANDFNITAGSYDFSGSSTIIMGNGTWTASGTNGTVWTTTAGPTFTPEGSTISITSVNTQQKTFAGGGKTYNHLTITGGGTGAVRFTGSNTFNVFTINPPKTVHFTAGTTTTVTTFTAVGSVGNVITIASITAATHTLSQASGTVASDYLNLTNSIATGGAAWYAGANSTDGGGNTGWIFTDVPSAVGGYRTLMGVGI